MLVFGNQAFTQQILIWVTQVPAGEARLKGERPASLVHGVGVRGETLTQRE